jgi:hypothetical protein
VILLHPQSLTSHNLDTIHLARLLCFPLSSVLLVLFLTTDDDYTTPIAT